MTTSQSFLLVIIVLIFSLSVQSSNLRVQQVRFKTSHSLKRKTTITTRTTQNVLAPSDVTQNMSSLDELVDEAMKNADLSIQTFEEMDKNLDGYLDEEEYPGDIEALDTNGDGKISAQELSLIHI